MFLRYDTGGVAASRPAWGVLKDDNAEIGPLLRLCCSDSTRMEGTERREASALIAKTISVAATRPAWRVLKEYYRALEVSGGERCSDSTRMEGTERPTGMLIDYDYNGCSDSTRMEGTESSTQARASTS